MDNAVALRCIAATIVDLSVKGYLAIEPSANNKLPGQTDNQDYVFHLIKPPSEWNSLKAHEHAVLGAIFPPTNPLRMLADALSRLQKVAGSSAHGASFLGCK